MGFGREFGRLQTLGNRREVRALLLSGWERRIVMIGTLGLEVGDEIWI